MQPNSFSMTSETRGTSILPLLNLWVECMSPESGGPSAQQVRLTARECAHISLNLQNNIYSGREDRKSQAFSTYFINTSIYVLFLFSSPLPLQPSDSLWISFSETTVCWLIQALGIWSIFFVLFFYAHMYIYFSRVLSGRCSCFCCLHASFSVCGGMLLAETMESCLRVIRSNSAWTSVKPGFCPWKKRQETKPKSNLL